MVKMALKFCANLSFMFTESGSLLERYNLARLAGFQGVESAFPKGFSIEDLLTAKQSLTQVLINIRTGAHASTLGTLFFLNSTVILRFLGTVSGGEFGVAALHGDPKGPDFRETFRSDLQTTVEYAKALNCRK